jgi:hypothetical protein
MRTGDTVAAEAAAFVIKPAIALGLLIGVYEFILLSRDVSVPTHKFGHGIQAIVLSTLFTLITMNTQWFIDNFAFVQGIPLLNNVHILRAVVGLIAVIKIHAASAAIKGGGGSVGLAEKWSHSLIVGALIVAAPYVYPAVKHLLPAFLQE